MIRSTLLDESSNLCWRSFTNKLTLDKNYERKCMGKVGALLGLIQREVRH